MTGVVLNALMAMASGCSMRLQPRLDSLAGTHPSLESCQSYTICAVAHVEATMDDNNKLTMQEKMRKEVVITLSMD